MTGGDKEIEIVIEKLTKFVGRRTRIEIVEHDICIFCGRIHSQMIFIKVGHLYTYFCRTCFLSEFQMDIAKKLEHWYQILAKKLLREVNLDIEALRSSEDG